MVARKCVPSFGTEVNRHNMVVGGKVINQGLQNATCIGHQYSWLLGQLTKCAGRRISDATLPDTGSNDLILFKFERFRMSSSLTGTLPPTRPVFPPCGTIPILLSLQYLTILLTSSVVRGLSTVVEFPLYFPIQSSLNAVSSSAAVFDGERVDRMEDGAMNLEKCARSSAVTEFKFGDTLVEVHL